MSERLESVKKNRLDRQTIDRPYNKAQTVLEQSTIDLGNFINVEGYNKKKVQADKENSEETYHKFTAQNSAQEQECLRRAQVLEAVMFECDKYEWLGHEFSMVKTSLYDDLHGVDMVAEREGDDKGTVEHLGLAIDVTSATDEAVINKKIKSILNEIDSGELAMVEYFISDLTDYKGRLIHIPRVLITADSDTIDEVGELWVTNNKDELAKHWLQFQILQEIVDQLQAFANYAERKNKMHIAGQLRAVHKIIAAILHDKEQQAEQRGANSASNASKRDRSFHVLSARISALRYD